MADAQAWESCGLERAGGKSILSLRAGLAISPPALSGGGDPVAARRGGRCTSFWVGDGRCGSRSASRANPSHSQCALRKSVLPCHTRYVFSGRGVPIRERPQIIERGRGPAPLRGLHAGRELTQPPYKRSGFDISTTFSWGNRCRDPTSRKHEPRVFSFKIGVGTGWACTGELLEQAHALAQRTVLEVPMGPQEFSFKIGIEGGLLPRDKSHYSIGGLAHGFIWACHHLFLCVYWFSISSIILFYGGFVRKFINFARSLRFLAS